MRPRAVHGGAGARSREGEADIKKTTARDVMDPGDRIVVCGAGGFIGGALVKYFHQQGFRNLRAVDKKPLGYWYQTTPGAENLCLDLSEEPACRRAV